MKRKKPADTARDRVEKLVRPEPGAYVPESAPRVVTAAQRRERDLMVESLWIGGATREQIVRTLKAQLGAPRNSTLKALERVTEKVRSETDSERALWKSQQIRRLFVQQRRLQAIATKAAGGERPQYSAAASAEQSIVSIERLLADIMGTKEPLRVSLDVTLNAAVAQVVQQLTPKQLDELNDRYAEQQRKAKLYDALSTQNGV